MNQSTESQSTTPIVPAATPKTRLPGTLRLGWAFPAVIVAIVLAWVPSAARAGLLLNVSTATQTLWFTGSDSGTAGPSGSFGQVTWGSPGSESIFDFTNLFTITGGTFSNLRFDDNGTGLVYIRIGLGNGQSGAAITITGGGPTDTFSYAGQSATFIAALNASAASGISLPLSSGTGFSSMGDTLAVPEPSTWAPLGVGCAGLLGLRLRRARRVV